MSFTTIKFKRILTAIGTIMLLTGISACSSVNALGSQTEQSGTIGSQEAAPETSVVVGETPKAVEVQDTMTGRTDGFDTPEDAARAYLDGLRASDLSRMMNTFAVENYLDHYISVLKSKDSLGIAETANAMREIVQSPVAKKFYERDAVENRESSIADNILSQYAAICCPALASNPVHLEGNGKASRFVEQLSVQMRGTDFSSLKLLGFLTPDDMLDAYDSSYDSNQYQLLISGMAQMYGADQFANPVAVIDIAGEKSILIFEAAKYDGKWYNTKLGGNLADLIGIDVADAGVAKLDEEDGEQVKQRMKEHGLLEDASSPAPVPAPADAVIESAGFDSPQMAAAAYLEGLKAGDLSRMTSAFAVESYVEYYNLQAYLEQMGSYRFLQQEISLPVVDGLSRAIDIQSRKKEVVEQVAGQFATVCILNGSYYGNLPMPEAKLGSNDYVQGMANMIDATDMDSMKILGYIPPEALSKDYGSDNSLKSRTNQAEICGADKQESCAIAFEIGKNKYVICPDTVEYKGKWYIKTLSGQLAAQLSISDTLKGTMPMDEESLPGIEKEIVEF